MFSTTHARQTPSEIEAEDRALFQRLSTDWPILNQILNTVKIEDTSLFPIPYKYTVVRSSRGAREILRTTASKLNWAMYGAFPESLPNLVIKEYYLHSGEALPQLMYPENPTRTIVSLIGNEYFTPVSLHKLTDTMIQETPGFTTALKTDPRLKIVSGYIEQGIFIVYVNKITQPFLRMLWAIMVKVHESIMKDLPEYDTIVQLSRYLGTEDFTRYCVKLSEIYEPRLEEAERLAREKALLEFANNIRTQAIQRYQRKVNDLKQSITYAQDNLRSLWTDFNQAQNNLTITQNKDSNKVTAFMKTIQDNPNTRDIQIEGDIIYITLQTQALFYDRDLAEKLADTNSYYITNIMNDPVITKAMRAVFVDQKYTMFFRTIFGIDLIGVTLSKRQPPAGYLGNPHIANYNCWGNNLYDFEKACYSEDYETAFLVCDSALHHLNLADGPVTEALRLTLKSNMDANYFIKNDTGELMSINDILKEINNETT